MNFETPPCLPNLAVAWGATTPVPNGGAGSLAWSTTLGMMVVWDGSNWLPPRPLPKLLKIVADRNLTNTASAQDLFDSPASVTLAPGIYEIEGLLWVSAMSATSGNARISWLGSGSATTDAWLWDAVGIDNNNALNAAASPTGSASDSHQSPVSIVTAAVNTAMRVRMGGTMRVTASGTMVPQITLVTAAAAVLEAGSYMMYQQIAA